MKRRAAGAAGAVRPAGRWEISAGAHQVSAGAGKGFAALVLMTGGLLLSGCGAQREPATEGGPIVIRRLTAEQYRHSIADVFGPKIKVVGRFEPGVRQEGLLAVGAGTVTVTPAGFEQFQKMARSIASQAVQPEHRAGFPCQPAGGQADEGCARQIVSHYGRLLFRRPLSEAELERFSAVALAGARTLGDFYAGIELGLSGLLIAPEFLFRQERAEPDPQRPGAWRLEGYSKATRLSFLLWDSTPDEELLRAAQAGELHSEAGLQRQVDRLIGSPRLEAGVRAFFSDLLGFERFDSVAKDTVIFPKYGANLAADAKEQTLRTITDLLITRQGDYRELFTTRRTFMTRALGMVYAVPVESPQGWEPYEFPPGHPRTGILSQVSFLSLHSHPGRSSPTLRGKALRELLLCQPVPPPPNNVNFTSVEDTDNPQFATARDRLEVHRTDAVCAGCHKITDPIGLGLEHFDGLGEYRSTENGARIDASGEFDGRAFKDSSDLGQALYHSPIVTSCLVSSVYRYASGRGIQSGEQAWQRWLERGFEAQGYRLPALLRAIATSEGFYRIAPGAVHPEPASASAEARSTDSRSADSPSISLAKTSGLVQEHP